MKTTIKINAVFKDKNKQMLLIENESLYPLNIELNKEYRLELNEIKSKRNLEQNKKLWVNIHRLSKELGQDDMKTYCELLEEADVKSDYIMTSCDIENDLRKTFRGVMFVNKLLKDKKEYFVYKVYFGSSTMNTKECSELIEILMNKMGEVGIYDNEYDD